MLDAARVRRMFGDGVKNVWIPRDTEHLDQLVKEREQTAIRLEKAENKLITMANKERVRRAKLAEKEGKGKSKSKSLPETTDPVKDDAPQIGVKKAATSSMTSSSESDKDIHGPHRDRRDAASQVNSEATLADTEGPSMIFDSLDSPTTTRTDRTSESKDEKDEKELDLSKDDKDEKELDLFKDEKDGKPLDLFLISRPTIMGSVAQQWVPAEKRPSHRPLANMGKRVDTIKWTRSRLKELTPRINKLRRAYRNGKGKPIPAVFVEFHTQAEAQTAYQTLAHHRAFHMSPDIVGVRPNEIIWSSMRMMWWERIVRRFVIQGAIAAMVVFWSIPSALVGIISNVNMLETKVPFLHWVKDLPSPILGFISGLLPAIALSCLMSIVPAILRGM